MTTGNSGLLIDTHEPAPVIVFNAKGRSPFLITGDHAGNAIPRTLGTLGLSAADRVRHIAWDIGVRDVGMMMAQALDAPFIHQHYSRLVIDCNRDPASPEAMPTRSDGSPVPGNEGLSDQARKGRIEAIHVPYQDRIAAEIAQRAAADRPTVLIALHSFTPAMAGIARPWHVGVLYGGGETGFATALLKALRREEGITVGDNEPYRMDDTDYTIPRHAFARGLAYAEIEVRQDLIAEEAGQRAWSERLCDACHSALAEL